MPLHAFGPDGERSWQLVAGGDTGSSTVVIPRKVTFDFDAWEIGLVPRA